MEKVSYIEKIYEESKVIEEMERNPLKVENDGKIIGFRFFDKEIDENNAENNVNYSEWFYFGKRATLQDVEFDWDLRKTEELESEGYKYVCKTQTGKYIPMEKDDVTFEEYTARNEKNKTEKVKNMLSNLENHIGEKVTCEFWRFGRLCVEAAILKFIGPNDIIIESAYSSKERIKICYVGLLSALSKVTSENGETLYVNSTLPLGYNETNAENVEYFERVFFGDELIDEKKLREKEEKEEREKVAKKIRESQKDIQKLITEGLTLVKSETSDEWIDYVNKNSNDIYSAQVIESSIYFMKKIEEGVPFYATEREIDYSLLNTSMFEAVAWIVSHFSKHDEEFKKYWSSRYGEGDLDRIEEINSLVSEIKNNINKL